MGITSPVSLSKIKNAFTGTNRFTDHIRGGIYVPNISANLNIATTAAGLKMSQFLGASASAGGPLTADALYTDLFANRATAGVLSKANPISVSGGSGSYTFSTVVTSGVGSLSGPATATPTITMSASPQNEYTGSCRTTVSDGTTTIIIDWTYDFVFGMA